MNIRSVLLASVFAMSGVPGVNAADTVQYEKPVVAVDAREFSWAGGYVGGQVGYGWGKSRFTDPNFSDDVKPDGFVGGFYAGYNFDLGNNIILGVDGDFTYNDVKDSFDEDLGIITGAESELRWSGAVRGRAGYAAGRFLPYIAGGVAFGSVKNMGYFDRRPIGMSYVSASQSRTLIGWTAGAGVDYAVTNNVILRLEYRYTDYGSKDFSGSSSVFSFDTGNKFQTSDVRLGIGYKF